MATKNVNFDIDEEVYDKGKLYLDTHKFTDQGEIQFQTCHISGRFPAF